MTWTYAYTPSIWPTVFTIILLIVLAAFSWRRRSLPGAQLFAIACLISIMLATSILITYLAVEPEAKIFWFRFESIWWLPNLTATTCFFLDYAWPGRWLNRRTLALLSIAPLLDVLKITTNGFFSLSPPTFQVGESVTASYGPLADRAYLAYVFGLTLVNFIVFAWLFIRSPRHRWPVVLMATGQIALRVLFLVESPTLDAILLNVPEFVLPYIAYAVALFGFRILDPIPMARQTIIEQLQVGMLVLDPQRRVVSLNPTAQAILEAPSQNVRGRPIQELLLAYPTQQDSWMGSTEVILGAEPETRIYRMEDSILKDWRGLEAGHLLMLWDVTEQRLAQAQFLEQQKSLATLQERERLARELHDSLGQALATTHLHASSAKLLFARGEAAQMSECLDILAGITLQAEADMREYLLGTQTVISVDHPFFATLREFLRRYTRQYNLPVELSVPPELEQQGVPQTAAIQLLRIIQEALSNVRKHARATSARLAFTVTGGLLQITLCDDGQGFEPAAVAVGQAGGFGLRSMRERAEELGGCLGVTSHPGQGTQLIVKVPVSREQ